MQIQLPELSVHVKEFLRRNGYSSKVDDATGRLSFVRRLTADHYPRFHVYVEKDLNGKNYLSLHLDQKKASYAGSRAHQADYQGELIDHEAHRLMKSFYAWQTFKTPPPPATPLNWLKKIFKP